MKAAVLYEPEKLIIADYPEPVLEDNSVKIAVAYCGICGTDFHKYQGRAGSRPVRYPVPLGHEISGVVTQVGKAVSGFRRGDRVTVDPNWSCGKCWYCKNGKRHLCENSRGVVKGMAEFICAPEENVYHIPDSLSLKKAALTEPLACCMRGIDQLDIKLGQTVVVIGFGAIGQLIFQLLKHSAAGKIVIVEPVEEKRKLATEMGATLFINPNADTIGEALETAGIKSVEKVIECVGLSSTAQLALEIADRGATVVLFGVSEANSVVPLMQYDAFWKELTIKTSYINPCTTQRALNLLESGAVNADQAISRVIQLEEVPEEIRSRSYSRIGKVLVKITDEYGE